MKSNKHERINGVSKQRGAVSMLAAIWLTVAVVALGAIDVGNLFFARRALQSVADLAAQAATQVVDDTCSRATSVATGNAAQNGFPTAAGNTITTTCGRWDPVVNAGPTYYAAGATSSNAVQVTVSRTVPYLFLGPSRTVSATATARAANIGGFTIGTTLASIGAGPVNNLLNTLLGTNLNLSLASYQGMSDARIRIGDLVTAAGVGTVDQLLASKVTVAQLATLMLNALQTTTVLNTNLSTAIGALQSVVSANIPGNQTIALGNTPTTPGLLSIGLATTQSALNATISPLDALFVAAEIAKAGQSAVNVAAGLDLGVASATLQLQVVQPPVLAVGEAGKDANGNWRTQASSAQVRVYLAIKLGGLPFTGVLGTLLGSPILYLPLSIEVAPGTAWLASTSCAGPAAARRSVIGVQTGVASACVGDPPATLPAANAPFSCANPATLVNVLNLITIKANVAIPATVPSTPATQLQFDGVFPNADDFQSTNANATVLSTAFSGLLTSLSKPGALVVTAPLVGGLLSGIAPIVVGVLATVLNPLFLALDKILVPILQLLGAQVGVSTIHDLSLTCGESQLTY